MNQVEIAKELKVSQALISHILNNPKTTRIPESKKNEIFAFLKKSGYQHKRKKKTPLRRIAYITCLNIPELYTDLYRPYMLGVTEAAEAASFEIVIKNYNQDEASDIMEINDVTGYIVQSAFIDRKPFFKKENTVFVDNPFLGFDSVEPDNFRTIFLPMEYLVNKGHSKIAYWSMWNYGKRQNRSKHPEHLLNAFHFTLQEFGLKASEKYTYLPEAEKYNIQEIEENVIKFFRQWKTMKERPTAIITGDIYAIIMLKLAPECGISVPDDLSIIGSDNIASCEFSNPPLTSIEQNRQEMGRLSIELLNARLNRPAASPKRLICEPFLIERKSVTDIINREKTMKR
ncbi:MAG: hypothetical protein A2017_06825 [Lentisphaerae bacterium GWF2_44_16]|nr:MAG: hypothetical protein A2017_06825 [Lentisphaerae bacterium GWF2_44_16]